MQFCFNLDRLARFRYGMLVGLGFERGRQKKGVTCLRFVKTDISTIAVRFLLDVAWIIAAFLAAVFLDSPGIAGYGSHLGVQFPYLVIFLVCWCLIGADKHLYVSRRNATLPAILFSTVRAVFASYFGAVFLMALLLGLSLDRPFVMIFGCCVLLAGLAVTLLFQPGVWNLRRHGYNLRHLVIVGANERTVRLVEVLLAHEQYGYRLEGFLDDDSTRRGLLEAHGVEYLGPIAMLDQVLVKQVIDGVYITLPLKSCYETIESIAHLCEGVGVPVRLVADLFPLRLTSSEATSIDGMPMVTLRPGEAPQGAILRRTLDSLTALASLLVLSPILLLVGVLVQVGTGGPVFLLEQRHGLWRRPFRRVRFNVYTGGDRKRGMTRIGAFLSAYGFDRLPELVNVLLGQMSFDAPQQDAKGRVEMPEPGSRSRMRNALFHRRLARLWFAGADLVCICVAYLLALALSSPDAAVFQYGVIGNVATLVIFVLSWAGAAMDERLWSMRSGENAGAYLGAVLRAVCNAAVCSVLVTALFMPDNLEQDFLVLFCGTTLAALLATRLAARRLLLVMRRRGRMTQRALLIGANERTLRLAAKLRAMGQEIIGAMDDSPERTAMLAAKGIACLGPVDQLERVLSEQRVDRVYVTLPLRSCYEMVQAVVSRLEMRSVAVYLLADLLPLHIARSRITLVEDIPLLSLSPICEAYAKLAAKRLMDFLGATALILCLSPVFLLIAILIKLDSKGPVLFAQERVGQNQRRFRILKFRSMVPNAEALRAKLESANEADGPVFKIRNDPRVTRVGKYLRKLSLDEFPQLFNVWWGTMSLVGPRPPIPSEVEQYTWNQRRRLSVKPGMTGLWQVSGRSDIPFEQWVQLDLTYIDNWSLGNDILILFKTFKAVTSGRGAA